MMKGHVDNNDDESDDEFSDDSDFFSDDEFNSDNSDNAYSNERILCTKPRFNMENFHITAKTIKPESVFGSMIWYSNDQHISNIHIDLNKFLQIKPDNIKLDEHDDWSKDYLTKKEISDYEHAMYGTKKGHT